VILGLLNQADTVQYIKINKAFLGEGNVYQMATIHDSTNYNHLLNVTLQEFTNGNQTGTFIVDTTTSIAQDPGLFSNSPNQVLYRVKTPASHPLVSNAEYRLTVVNPATGYTATGKTNLVQNPGTVTWSGNSNPTAYDFFRLGTTLGNQPFKLAWKSGPAGRLYQTVMRFHYTEYNLSGVSEQYVDKQFGQFVTATTIGNEDFAVALPWSEFVSLIANTVPNTPGVFKRVFGKCELLIYVAHDEFNTYLQVNKPVSSITGDKPVYTNINNGIGLFSARLTYDDTVHFKKPLANATINNATYDSRICNLHFADANGNVPCP
jgi:hypothetical protein